MTKTKYAIYYDEWVELYGLGLNASEISRQYNCSGEAVLDLLRKKGIKIKTQSESNNKYNKFHKEWAQLYESGVNGHEISRRYNCSCCAVMSGLHAEGVRIKTNSQAQRKYELRNEGYFKDIDTPEKAYWLGFLMADGCISKRPSSCSLIIQIAAKDLEHIERFEKAIGSDAPISQFNDTRFNTKMARLTISSTPMTSDLIKHGCVPRKSFLLEFPKIETPLLSHFIRGYFDGDGHITINKERGATWGMVGRKEFLTEVQKNLVEFIGLNKIKIYPFKHSKTHMIQYAGNRQVRLIRDWLYTDSTISMDRKREKMFSIG